MVQLHEILYQFRRQLVHYSVRLTVCCEPNKYRVILASLKRVAFEYVGYRFVALVWRLNPGGL